MTDRAFYVSVINGRQRGLLLGPFPTHDAALDRVEDVRAWVIERKPEAHFYGFGTASVPSDRARPGSLNSHLS